MISTVRGRFHSYQAEIDLRQNDLTHSSFQATIDVASIDTHVAARDRDLRSERFFDVVRYPTMRFRSTEVEALGGNRFAVSGDFTLKDVTCPLRIEGEYAGDPVRDPWGVLRTGMSGHATLNRKVFGLSWNQVLESGGFLIGDDVEIQLDLELMWQEDPATSTS
jgi:polyisoprenoid-binding protein YceI